MNFKCRLTMKGKDRIWSRPKNSLLRTKRGWGIETAPPSPVSDGADETFSLMNSLPIKEPDRRRSGGSRYENVLK